MKRYRVVVDLDDKTTEAEAVKTAQDITKRRLCASVEVEVTEVDVDEESSVSSQHYINTGRYLLKGEVESCRHGYRVRDDCPDSTCAKGPQS